MIAAVYVGLTAMALVMIAGVALSVPVVRRAWTAHLDRVDRRRWERARWKVVVEPAGDGLVTVTIRRAARLTRGAQDAEWDQIAQVPLDATADVYTARYDAGRRANLLNDILDAEQDIA